MDESSMNGESKRAQAEQRAPTTAINPSNAKVPVDDDDEEAAFLNHCIEREAIDFEQIAEDKRNAIVDGRFTSRSDSRTSVVRIDEPMPGNDANSPSITNELRNEELERRQAVASNYDMFADDYLDTNVSCVQVSAIESVHGALLAEFGCMASSRQ